MGPLLAIDSSSSSGSVAIGNAEGVIAEVFLDSLARGEVDRRQVRVRHSSALMPAVDYALRSANLEARDLGGVVVGAGPGSFTGLRIAGATAKGIVHALRIPLFAYSSLLATAVQAWAATGPVCALFCARGRDVYAACYRFGPQIETMLPPMALALEGLIERMRGEEAATFVGDGALLHRQELVDELGARVGPAYFAAPRAAGLLWLADAATDLGRISDASQWQPDYLHPSGAERIAAARKTESEVR